MDSHAELELNQNIFASQLSSIKILTIGGLGVLIIELIFPSFFNYPYLRWEISPSDIFVFWPLFLYGFVIAARGCLSITSSNQRNNILASGMITSILAGILEEFGYRAIFICYAMIGLLFFNFLWSLGAGLVGVIPGVIVVGLAIYFFNEEKKVIAAVLLCGGLVLGWIGLGWGIGTDPLYWFYNAILIPIINFITLWQFDTVFNGGHEPLFIFGAVVANARFRDGHKYQGILGVINSWFIGFVMLYATVTYGLLVAVIIHAVYDLEFDLIGYSYRHFIR